MLRELLLADYAGLNRRLTRQLGSADFASDVLQETYLRLEQMKEVDAMHSPKSYLFRIALNIANDRRRSEKRRLTEAEVESLLDVPDDQPDPGRIVEARHEVELLQQAIAELPPRRRQVLVSSRIEGIPHREIAQSLGVTVRTVEIDLKQALEHCAQRLKLRVSRFALRPPGSSHGQGRTLRGRRPAAVASGNALTRDRSNPSHRVLGSPDP